MSDYLQGLLTIPAVALIVTAIVVVAAFAIKWARQWWLSPVEFKEKDLSHRARHASCVMAARRVWAFKLPGSRLLIFRSTVGLSDYEYGTYYTETAEGARRARAVLLDEFAPLDGDD